MTSPRTDIAARRAAVRILSDCLDAGTPLDIALGRGLGSVRLEPRDRGFVRTLVSTSLRRLGRLDAVIGAFLERPLPAEAGAARAILRLAACQILCLDTPAYAAVDTMTETAEAEARRFKGLVNAVARKIAGPGREIFARLSPLDDWPAWLTRGWANAYGPETAAAIAAASGAEAPLDLSVRDGDGAAWAERLGGALTPTGSVRLPSADVEALAGFGEGAWWVQDAAAAIPARLFGAVRGLRVLDLCAAPGGKTLQLAAAGAQVTALDRSEDRVRRLRENLARCRLEAEVVVADGRTFEPPAPFDAVLLDAPCSATGTLRRRPDVAWRRGPKDIAALAALEGELLDSAARLVRPGGLIVYCTCSLEPAEGPEIVAAALAASPGLVRVPIAAAEVPGLDAAITAAGDLRTHPALWPEIGGLDGFFIARLARIDGSATVQP